MQARTSTGSDTSRYSNVTIIAVLQIGNLLYCVLAIDSRCKEKPVLVLTENSTSISPGDLKAFSALYGALVASSTDGVGAHIGALFPGQMSQRQESRKRYICTAILASIISAA
eukprot:scaffold352734_cov27-Prasinocladus_malaysianus.AAC.1